MNNKRKDILRKGIDVTLYPLPFRKGGKIMNAGMGDKTVKPGIEYGNGGGLPKINDLRRPKVASDATRMTSPLKPLGPPNQDMGRILSTKGVSPFNPTPSKSAGPVYGSSSARRSVSKFNLGGMLNGGDEGNPDPKKVNHVSRFGDKTYEAPETETDLPVVNRYGLPFYRLGRTEFQMMPGVEYPQLNTLKGASGTPESVKELPQTSPEFTPTGQQPGSLGQQAKLFERSLGQRKSKFGI